MDYKKYYKLDYNGCYSVHFLNTKKMNLNQIKEIFSKFGKVLTVNVTNSEGGYRFVRYKTLEEIRNCIDGLKDNTEIVLLPERKDQYKKMNRNLSPKKIVDNTDKQSNENFKNNNKVSETRFQEEKCIYNTKTSNCADDTDNSLDTDFPKTSICYKTNVSEVKVYDKQDVLVSEEEHLFRRRNFNSNSSSSKINYDKYYKILKDGSYLIHFANKKRLSEEEITKIFSNYGTVSSIYSGGDNNGLRFVKYKNLDHIISCLNGLQNNSLINILPQKDKIMQVNQKDSDQQQITLEDSSQKMSNEKQFNSTSISDWNNRSNSSFVDFQSSLHNYKPSVNTIQYERLGSLIKTKLHSLTKTDGNTHINKNMPDDNTTSCFDTEIMQKEFATSDCLLSKDASSKIRVLLQEIIVANIHTDYGIHYILHLFEKYDPISATFIKVTPETNVRYCRVYFKTVQDAVAVEEKFDNYVLSGKNLIVLRESELIEKAK